MQVEAANEPALGQRLCVISTQLRGSDHLPPICGACELSHSWMGVRCLCPPPQVHSAGLKTITYANLREVVGCGHEGAGRGPGVQLLMS